jgi:3-oxoacyl-[acyl-carrier protein] reductase
MLQTKPLAAEPAPQRHLGGRSAIVTGSTSGIGLGVAAALAARGANVMLNGFGPEKEIEQTRVGLMHAHDVAVIYSGADMSRAEDVAAMVEEARAAFGQVDILVNNAGGLQVNPETSFASTVPEEDLRREVDRNLMSCIFCSQAAARSMKAQQYGKIVNVSSQAGLKGSANGFYSSYGMAKAAVINYTQYLGGELAPYGINVNCIAPAFIGTNRLMERSFNKNPGQLEALEKTIPIGRVGTEEDCARVVEFLVTDLSDYIVGQTIKICGGVLLF